MQAIHRLLTRAFTLLENTTPPAYFRIHRELHGLRVALQIRDESLLISTDGLGLRIASCPDPAADIRVTANTRAVLDIIDGRTTPLQAILARDLTVYGPPPQLPRLSQACSAFAEGAVRTPAMRALLDELRGLHINSC